MIRFRCVRCQQGLEVADGQGGQKVACSKCGQHLIVPTPPLPPLARTTLAPLDVSPPTAAIPSLPSSPVPIRISAHIIRWPLCCASCCGPAYAVFRVSAVRQSGVKVVRTQEKTWDVPYCSACLGEKAKAEEERDAMLSRAATFVVQADAERDTALANAREAREAKKTTDSAMGAVALVLVVIYLFASVGVVLAADGAVRRGITAVAMLVVGVVGLAILGAIINAVSGDGSLSAEEAAQLQARVSALLGQANAEREAARAMPIRAGVVYEGWQGTVHTVVFSNPAYGQAFREANAGKCLA